MSSALPPLSEVEEAFSFFDDWEDRYRYIMDLGEKLPAMADADRIEANVVYGCQSAVWVVLHESGGEVQIDADSDSQLVKGLAALVVIALKGQSAAEIVAMDIAAVFDRLRLHEHLSPTRSNGLAGMIQQVRSKAVVLEGNN